MITLTSLPSEVIDIILSYNDISFEDIINFRFVCKRFRWSSAKNYYNRLPKENEQNNSKKNEQKDKECVSFIVTDINCVRQLRNYIPQIMFISKCNNVNLRTRCELRLYENLDKIIKFETGNYTQILLFMDDIEHLLTQSLRVGYDLMEGYCYLKLFDYLRICWIEYIFRKYIKEKSYHKKHLEESATILAQQLQPGRDVPYWSVKLSLNIIALDALNFLKEKHPNHSIFTPDECFSRWENGNIDDNYWSKTEGTQVMDTLEEYMFGKLNFRPVESRELEYMCIDYVLENKHGNMIIIYIIFESVARRLGLRCDIVTTSLNPSFDIYLFWIPRYIFTANNTGYSSTIMNEEYKNTVRCFNISFGKFPDCINQCYFTWPPLRQKKFAEILELVLQKEPQNYVRGPFFDGISTVCDYMLELVLQKESQNYVRHGLFFDGISTVCDHIKNYVPETRPKKTKFAVGMIVRHGDESTNCSTGVIIGWYQSNFDNEKVPWPIRNISDYVMPLKCSNVNTTKDRQTYYLILTKSDKLCHVEEDVITLTKPNWIKNRHIYRYFSKFEGTHYVPNKMLERTYPYDAAVTARTIFRN